MNSINRSTADLESLGHQIQSLTTKVQRARHNKSEDLGAQNQLLEALDNLRAGIVGPAKWPSTLSAPFDIVAMQIAFQRQIFQNVPSASGTSINVRDLAALAKMDEGLLLRIMRCLAANNMFVETEEKVFAHTSVSADILRRGDIVVMISTGGEERSLKDFEGLVKAADEQFELDRVHQGRDQFSVLSIKLLQHDLGAAQVADKSPLNNGLDGTGVGSAGVTSNHSGVVEELKSAETGVLAS